MSATTLAAAIRAKELSPVEIVQAVFARIDAINSKTNAFCTLTVEQSLLAAKDAEAAVMRSDTFKEKNVGEGSISSDRAEIAFELRRKTGHLGIIRQDGSDLREYPDLDEPYDIGWSPDGTALTLSVKNMKQGKEANRSLQILNLGSGTTKEVDAKGSVTSQCWSPDGKQIVYQAVRCCICQPFPVRKATITSGTFKGDQRKAILIL